MHVVTTERRSGEAVYNTTLLRRSYREGGKVKKQTLANLSHLPPEIIELIRGALRGTRYVTAGEGFEIERSVKDSKCPSRRLFAFPKTSVGSAGCRASAPGTSRGFAGSGCND